MNKILILAVIASASLFSCSKKEDPAPATKTTTQTSTNTGSNCTAVQCSAIAKSTNQRCKNKTTNCNGKCYQHQ